MTQQTEAQRLADVLEELDAQFTFPGLCSEAAAELRRLDAVNAQLLEVLEELMYWDNGKPEYDDARAAIAAAKGEA